jgi:hypothetical protein
MATEPTEKIRKFVEKGIRVPHPLSVEEQPVRAGDNK